MLAALDEQIAHAAPGHQQVLSPYRGQPRIDQRQVDAGEDRGRRRRQHHMPGGLPARVAVDARHLQQRGRRAADAVHGVDHHGHQGSEREKDHLGHIAQPKPDRDQRNPGKQRDLLEGIETGPHETAEARPQPQQPAQHQPARAADDKAGQLAQQTGPQIQPELTAGDEIQACSQHLQRRHQQRRVDPVEVRRQRPQQHSRHRQHQAAPARRRERQGA